MMGDIVDFVLGLAIVILYWINNYQYKILEIHWEMDKELLDRVKKLERG